MSRPTDWYVLDLPGDPVPGDPSTISDVARKWSSVADDADTARTQISSLLGDQAVMQWLGKAGDAFRSHSNKLPGQLAKCADSYHQAASALTRWSCQLEGHQAAADHALVLGRAALQDLHNAQNQLSAAQGSATSASSAVDSLNATTRQAAHDTTVPAPDPAQVRAAVNRTAAASQAVSSAQHQVGDAQARLDAAKRMAADAAGLRDHDGHTTATRLHDAADAGIHPDSFWHKLGDALGKAWHVLVEIAKVVVIIASIIAIVVGGPIAWIAFAAAVIILADTVAQYAQGKASLLDVGLAALGCIPGEGMLEDLGVVGKLTEDANAVRTGTEEAASTLHELDEMAAYGDPQSLEEYLDVAERLDVSTDTDAALFYSGGEGAARGAATEFAEGNGRTILEGTPGGKWLDERALFDEQTSPLTRAEAFQVWKRVSERYAEQASGNLHAFHLDPSTQGAWLTTERRVLLQGLEDGRVNSLTEHNLTDGSVATFRSGRLDRRFAEDSALAAVRTLAATRHHWEGR